MSAIGNFPDAAWPPVQNGKERRGGLLSMIDAVRLAAFRLAANGRGILLPPDFTALVGALSTNGTAHLRSPAGNAFVESTTSSHITCNLYFDGTNWNLMNTGLPGWLMVVAGGQLLNLYTAPAAANPATLTVVGSFTPNMLGQAMNPPRAHVWGNGTSQTVNNTTITPVLFNAVIYNNGGATGAAMWAAGSPGRFTIAVAGTYEVGGTLVFNNGGGGTFRMAFLRINGTALKGAGTAPPLVGGQVRVSAHTVRSFAAGDFVELCAYQDSGGVMTVLGSGEEESFHIQYLGQ